MHIVSLLAFSIMSWLSRLGGPGLILLGIADNSLVPLPGSMDVVTVLLASWHRDWWPYYGAMATAGALVGGYITYGIAQKSGEEALAKKLGRERFEGVRKKFERHGFSTIAIGSILPPPFPLSPLLMVAGVLQYPAKKFLGTLAVGRGARYMLLAWLGHRYGKHILRFFTQYRQPVVYALIGLAVLAGIGALIYFKWWRPRRAEGGGRTKAAATEHAA